MKHVTVEFYGIPRLKTEVPTVSLQAESLQEVFEQLAESFPLFESHCLLRSEDGAWGLKKSFLMSRNGLTFDHSQKNELQDQDTIMILSADAGG